MQKIETTYTIKITIEEANTITEALHDQYKELKKIGATEEAGEIQTLRNSFSSLCNRSYMGENA